MAPAVHIALALALPSAGLPAAATSLPCSSPGPSCAEDVDGDLDEATWLLQLGHVLAPAQRAGNATGAPLSLIADKAKGQCRHVPRIRGEPKTALAWSLAGSMAAVFAALVLAALCWEGSGGHFAFLVAAFLATGVGAILVKDLMANSLEPAEAGGPVRGFNYPSLANFSSYLGMTVFFPLQLLRPQAEREAGKRPPPPLWALLGMVLLHYLSLGVVNYVYRLLPGSLIQMLQSSRLLFTGVLGYVMLGRAVQERQILAMSLALVGVLVAGIGTAQAKAAADGACEETWLSFCLGAALVLFAELVRSILFLFQELLLRSFAISPMRLTASIGTLGLFLSAPALLAVQQLGLEDLRGAMYQLRHSPLLALTFATSLLAVGMFEYVGISVTSRSNASVRAMLELLRVALVWFLEVRVGWNSFTMMQASGFAALILGCLLDSALLPEPRPAGQEQRQSVKTKERQGS